MFVVNCHMHWQTTSQRRLPLSMPMPNSRFSVNDAFSVIQPPDPETRPYEPLE
jgi:hypothetical protein